MRAAWAARGLLGRKAAMDACHRRMRTCKPAPAVTSHPDTAGASHTSTPRMPQRTCLTSMLSVLPSRSRRRSCSSSMPSPPLPLLPVRSSPSSSSTSLPSPSPPPSSSSSSTAVGSSSLARPAAVGARTGVKKRKNDAAGFRRFPPPTLPSPPLLSPPLPPLALPPPFFPFFPPFVTPAATSRSSKLLPDFHSNCVASSRTSTGRPLASVSR
eukprot:364299-Chlamydomonas_euryale.AAC.2